MLRQSGDSCRLYTVHWAYQDSACSERRAMTALAVTIRDVAYSIQFDPAESTARVYQGDGVIVLPDPGTEAGRMTNLCRIVTALNRQSASPRLSACVPVACCRPLNLRYRAADPALPPPVFLSRPRHKSRTASGAARVRKSKP